MSPGDRFFLLVLLRSVFDVILPLLSRAAVSLSRTLCQFGVCQEELPTSAHVYYSLLLAKLHTNRPALMAAHTPAGTDQVQVFRKSTCRLVSSPPSNLPSISFVV